MRAGFIGLGTMGWHMAGHLHAAGHLAGVWSRTADKAARRAGELGVTRADTPSALWDGADAVVLCVRADAEVLAVVDALCVPEAAGRLVIDASTVSDATAREASARLARVGARFVDAPVTGGAEGARQGTLTFMAGGAEADVAAAGPLFEAMGKRWVHLGAIGAGQACKAVNQVMAAGINQAVCEGLALAEASGLDPDQVVEVVGSGAAGSWFVNNRGRTMVAGAYPPGFRMDLHLKDLRISQRMAADRDLPLPVVDRTVADYAALVDAGHGDDDISGLYRQLRARRTRPRRSPAPEPYWFEEGCWISEWWNAGEDDAVSIVEARVPAGGSTRMHALTGTAERYVVLSGTGTAEVAGERHPLARGDALLIPPEAPQRIINTGDGELIFLAVCTPRFRPGCYQEAAD
ncbi:NAD(P)-binding domain-containing protein [Algiphilus sp.]|uniref:NAD(P)-binding domain-containing protein n=1 Tax=Algiphilus sp. TaxID=1872431 RepID=UPI003C5EA45A